MEVHKELTAEELYIVTYLTKKHIYLVNCEVEKTNANYVFIYDTESLTEFTNCQKESEREQYRLLLAVSHLSELVNRYSFNLRPSNLYYTREGIVKVQERKLPDDSTTFTSMYKALIGSVISEQYTYDVYINGGESLLKANKELQSLVRLESIEEIIEFLQNKYDEAVNREQGLVYISKTKYRIRNTFLGVLILCFIITNGYGVYFHCFIYPDSKQQLTAYQYYVAERYVDTILELESKAMGELQKEEKYLLAISYIKTSHLEGEARANALSQISMQGSEVYLEYWIYLGRKEFGKAYEVVATLDNQRLLHYAYSVELASLETNSELSNAEKKERKEELEKELNQYLEALEKQNKESD